MQYKTAVVQLSDVPLTHTKPIAIANKFVYEQQNANTVILQDVIPSLRYYTLTTVQKNNANGIDYFIFM